ncbi:nicotinamide/nicotinic acid mononucleotide adenylyltransferase 3-like isoform X2 [Leptotrombidium deliense]|uniref:Nicotinamide/nicotinic acid mononucleotide adenylyltransferase 3-like isoform X2 n=1 Tax=Leptotrombidium deliense TaxID=299467 RepID=A0A443SWC1_9ACAR|nr:nicotinamide/nicotinic acid mononucleotide adenylyltransferase 3-like isoform X2 [Leptotrombidium deliense]
MEEYCESQVIRGVISPVSDKYSKPNLVASHHRVEMVRRALSSSNCNWIQVDDFESKQTEWMTTLKVLKHVESSLNINNATVKLLCGADLIETFSVPNLWKDDDIKEIVTHYGIVVIPRKGWNPDKYISEHHILKNHMKDVIVVKSWEGDNREA